MRAQPERRFYHRLALGLGCTVGELLRRCTSRELADWMAYELLEPFGPPAVAFNAGLVASTVYNMNRGSKAKALGPMEFMPQIDRPPETPAQRKRRDARALSDKIKRVLGPLAKLP